MADALAVGHRWLLGPGAAAISVVAPPLHELAGLRPITCRPARAGGRQLPTVHAVPLLGVRANADSVPLLYLDETPWAELGLLDDQWDLDALAERLGLAGRLAVTEPLRGWLAGEPWPRLSGRREHSGASILLGPGGVTIEGYRRVDGPVRSRAYRKPGGFVDLGTVVPRKS